MSSFFQHVQSDPPTAKSLSLLISQMIQFQEDQLGKVAKDPKNVRLPVRHFLDFTPDGPLCHILATMHQFKNEQGWRRFDFNSPSRKEANLEMCQKVEEALEKKKYHLSPKLFFSKGLSKDDKEKVKELAKKFKVSIIDNESDATHILYPSTELDYDMFCRGVFKRGDKCLVHFYRMPESHDNWGLMWPPEEKEPPEGIPDEKEEQYRVSVDWLFEAEEYNEFMCEEDYEVEENGQNKSNEMYMTEEEYSNCFEKPSKKKGKRKRSPSPTPSKGRPKTKGKNAKKYKMDEDEDEDEMMDQDETTNDKQEESTAANSTTTKDVAEADEDKDVKEEGSKDD